MSFAVSGLKSVKSRLDFSSIHPAIRYVSLVMLGILAIALGAHLTIPLFPVPITLQTFFVLLIAMTYGWRLATVTIAAYLALGLLNIPVFAQGFFSPSGGYLIGFLMAGIVVGFLTERGCARNIITAFSMALLGSALIYACGLPVLAWYLGSFQQAIIMGLVPFLAIDFLKMLVLAFVVPYFWHE
ncbi:MAG: biotin transporter BioY [Legionellales bacterium]|nr:biotin transporter BioY [Legionellales bacterium]